MPNATQVKTSSWGGNVVVSFDDGHTVTFYPNQGGWDEPATNEEIRLTDSSGQAIIRFYSPGQRPVNCRHPKPAAPFGFGPLKRAGYTAEQIRQYFTAARDYAAELFGRGEKTGEWHVVNRSCGDIDRIGSGEEPLATD